MNRSVVVASILIAVGVVSSGVANAQEKLRVGIIGQFSGGYSLFGKNYQQAIEAFQSVYGTKVGGREVEVLYRDVGGATASNAKRLTEELIVRDGAAIIGGFTLSPESIAAGPVLTETRTPGVVFNGAALAITQASPYIIRGANTQFQAGFVEAEWAWKHGLRRTYISVTDFAPGYDLLSAFKKRYLELGGEIVGEDKIPLNTVDYSPFIERVARAKPALFNMFVPSGAPLVNAVKAMQAQGLTGRKDLLVLGQAQLEEQTLPLFDDSVIGMVDALTYAIDAPGDENKKYKSALAAKFGPNELPTFYGASAWDGMLIIYHMIASQEGRKFDGEAAVKATLGFKAQGARGPWTVEPDSRGLTMDYYFRRAVKGADGKLKLEIMDTMAGVRSVP